MNILIQFLKNAGLGHPKSPGKSERARNREKWQAEKDKKEKKRGHRGHHFDNHHNPDDWTY